MRWRCGGNADFLCGGFVPLAQNGVFVKRCEGFFAGVLRLCKKAKICYNKIVKIGIDAFFCEGGTRVYLKKLSASLFENALLEKNSESCTLFGASLDRYAYSAEGEFSFCEVRLPSSKRAVKIWHDFFCPHFLKKQNFDAAIFPAATKILPSKFSIPSVAVINDTLSVMIKKSLVPKKSTLKKLASVQKIIAPTNFLKSDLESLGLSSKKISVVPHGIDHSLFFPREQGQVVEAKPFAIKKPYIIYPSTISCEEKKHSHLIRAFDIFKKTTRLPHRLVLAGAEDQFSAEVRKAALSSPFASDIFITGFFPRESLALLYSGAAACVFPSVQEGVGLPIIEAMACGVPVACSNAGALPETSGKNAVFFESDDEKEMAEAIERVCTEGHERSDLILRGLSWSEKFTWKECATKTLEAVREICGEKMS